MWTCHGQGTRRKNNHSKKDEHRSNQIVMGSVQRQITRFIYVTNETKNTV